MVETGHVTTVPSCHWWRAVSRFLAERTVERRNGAKERRLFSDAEYEARLASLR